MPTAAAPDPRSSNTMNVLAVSGSLRAASINSAFCRAAARLAAPALPVSIDANLGALPLFNPDLEANPPDAVRNWRAAVAGAERPCWLRPL